MAEETKDMAAEATGASGFDLQAFARRYRGHGLVKRLQFVAQRSPELRDEALQMAIAAAKRGINTSVYADLVTLSNGGAAADAGGDAVPGLDAAWVEETDRQAHKTLDRLSAELKTHQTNLLKDSIRQSHTALGHFHLSRGDFPQALKSFVRTRDYCTSTQHVTEMCLNVLKTSVSSGSFMHVAQYINKAEHLPDGADRQLPVKLNSCAALHQLSQSNYKNAARRFLAIKHDFGDSYAEVIHPFDVAVGGALCALASYSRPELRSKVVENAKFQAVLALVPAAAAVVEAFVASRYTECMVALDALRPQLELNMVFAPHVRALCNQIRQRAMIQYFSAYLTVQLPTMAAAFNCTGEQLEQELATLIMDGRIAARIDAHSQVLRARHSDRRVETYQRAMAVGQSFAKDAQATLLRLSLTKHDFTVRPRGGFGL